MKSPKQSTSKSDRLHRITLTNKRQKIFDIVLGAEKPLSAYDIADQYQKSFGSTIPAMSVYRILKFLSNEGLVHKLESINQYVVCGHLNCEHEHSSAQFLICDSCNTAKEITLTDDIHQLLLEGIAKTGFKLDSLQFELHGICAVCQQTK